MDDLKVCGNSGILTNKVKDDTLIIQIVIIELNVDKTRSCEKNYGTT